MRSILFTLLAGWAASGVAHAQSSVDWSGFYLGGNVGAAITAPDLRGGVADGPLATAYFNFASDIAQIDDAVKGTPLRGSFAGGAVGGYNVEVGNILIGIEAGANRFDGEAKRSVTDTYISLTTAQYTLTTTVKSNWIATLRPRLGWTHDNWLVYVTGGLAVTQVDVDVDFSDTNGITPGAPGAAGSSSNSAIKAGWTLGAGGEYALSPNWSLTGQYLFADFGSIDTSTLVTNAIAPGISSVIDSKAELRTHLFLLGASYRF